MDSVLLRTKPAGQSNREQLTSHWSFSSAWCWPWHSCTNLLKHWYSLLWHACSLDGQSKHWVDDMASSSTVLVDINFRGIQSAGFKGSAERVPRGSICNSYLEVAACVIGHNYLPPCRTPFWKWWLKTVLFQNLRLHINLKKMSLLTVVVEDACETWIIITMPVVSPVFSSLTISTPKQLDAGWGWTMQLWWPIVIVCRGNFVGTGRTTRGTGCSASKQRGPPQPIWMTPSFGSQCLDEVTICVLELAYVVPWLLML